MSPTGTPCDVPLLDYAYGELPPAEAAAVEHHLGGCEGCRSALAAMGTVRRTMAGLGQEAAPEAGLDSLLAYAEQAARRSAAGLAPARSGWRRWVAPLLGAGAVAVLALVALPVSRRAEVPLPSEVISAETLPAAAPGDFEARAKAAPGTVQVERRFEDSFGAPSGLAGGGRAPGDRDDDGAGAALGGHPEPRKGGSAVAGALGGGRSHDGWSASPGALGARDSKERAPEPSAPKPALNQVLPTRVAAPPAARAPEEGDAEARTAEADPSRSGPGGLPAARGGPGQDGAAEGRIALQLRAEVQAPVMPGDGPSARKALAGDGGRGLKDKEVPLVVERAPAPVPAPERKKASRAVAEEAAAPSGGSRQLALRRAVVEARDAGERRRALETLCEAERAEGVRPAEGCERLEREFPVDAGYPSR